MAGSNLASAVMDTPQTSTRSNARVTITPDTITLPEGYSLEQPQAAYSTVYHTLPPGYSIEGQAGKPRVTLDFSKAQPINPPVTLDFSKAEPLQSQPTPEQALSRTNANMAAAMSGQPQSTPEDQANFEAGRKAGTIQGGIDIAAGAGLGAATTGLEAIAGKAAPAAKMVATGLLDEMGNPIMRQQAVASIGKIPGLLKSAYDWANANPVKAYLLFRVANEIGLAPSGLKKIFHVVSGGE